MIPPDLIFALARDKKPEPSNWFDIVVLGVLGILVCVGLYQML
jgi:hypothetical protein